MANSGKRAEEVHEYWRDHGRRELGLAAEPPKKRDEYLQILLENEIRNWLRPDMKLLDIGCGDGTSTLRFAEVAGSAVGVDYAEERIEKAVGIAKERNVTNVEFLTADALKLEPIKKTHGQFDAIVMIRCLINLTSWNLQAKAIDNATLLLKTGGLLIISEGWQEGFDRVSNYRLLVGLEPLRLVEHNLYISRTDFEQKIGGTYATVGYRNVGFYLFMSRVFQPAFVHPGQPVHDHRINETAYNFVEQFVGSNEFADCDYAGVYTLRKLG